MIGYDSGVIRSNLISAMSQLKCNDRISAMAFLHVHITIHVRG